MMRSLYSAISGLGVNQQAMDVLGNNISNVNTVGYKSGRAVFEDLLSQTIVGSTAPSGTRGGTNSTQVGLGTSLAGVDTIFETGTMQSTSVNTDLAIQGEGFFVLRADSEDDFLYTRAGDFGFDASGALTTTSGLYVQGWMVDPETGELLTEGTTQDIVLTSAYQTAQAQATTEVEIAGVLDTEADPSILEYPSLLHYADTGDSIFEVYSDDGANMDLADNEAIKVKAHAAAMTDMGYVYNTSDVNMDLPEDTQLLVYINSNPVTIEYGADYTTMGGLANALETELNTAAGAADFSVYVTDGTIKVERTGVAGIDVSIDSFSGTPLLAVALSDLASVYDDISDTKSSDEMYFESQIYAGRDFSTMTELAVAIEEVIDGNVLPTDDFNVTYDSVTGQFAYEIDNNTNSANGTLRLSGFSLDKSYSGTVFENNIVPSGMVIQAAFGATDTGNSNTFLRTAQDDDPLTELFTSSGNSLGLDPTAIIQFSASVAGSELPGVATIPAATSTLDDLRVAIASYLGYDSATDEDVLQHIASFDQNSGKLQITGEKGESNEIDYVKFEVVGAGTYDTFYDYYEYDTVQTASGGSLTTSQTIFDAQGNPHTLQYRFELEDSMDNVWKLTMSTPDDGASVSFNETTGNTVFMHFNADGSFNYLSTEGGQRIASLSMNYDTGSGAGVVSDIEMGLGTAGSFDGIYISADEGGINSSSQDGYSTGLLESTLFNTAGEIIGYYTNGQVATIAQIATATFTNPGGLIKVGDTTFQDSSNSGDASIGKPGTGFRGEIASSTLENSNVDLSSQFVNMITTQRGFQANSRVITTSDEMLQELMSLKR
ncbi:MAG: flagellar hook-basal body complex protein [Deferribacterales bacterium]